MSGPLRLRILATETERQLFEAATALLARTLAEASAPVVVESSFPASLDVSEPAEAGIVIVSLAGEVDSSEDWPIARERLSRTLIEAVEQPGIEVFVCTVLRHVDRALPRETLQARRVRIRQLNLFAVEMSQATGLQVIDLDRTLSQIGALSLQTDYRLAGVLAAEAASRSVAITLLAAGLDDYAPYEAQEAARTAIEALEAPWQTAAAPAHAMIQRDLMEIGQGRRRQRISPVIDAMPDNQVAWFIRGVFTGQIRLGYAYQRLRSVVGNRGVRGSLGMIVAGSRTLVRARTKARGDHA